jgi:hypothetical protein
MKLFHKKFLNQDEEIKNTSEEISTQSKTKLSYLLNQFLIWGVILSIMFFIFKFLIVEFV